MRLSRILLLFFLILSACNGQTVELELEGGSFGIAYAEPLSSFFPFSYTAANRKYLVQVYEPLLRYDGTFNLETGLAVGWGRLDDTTWEFRLREGVSFHDGSAFDAEDVQYSLNFARESLQSDLRSILTTISEVETVDSFRIRIYTEQPDPLLLNKLSMLFIVPKDYENFEIPIGTGPYRFLRTDASRVQLERFPSYWGPAPYFSRVDLWYFPDPEERVQALQDGKVQLLANVPPQFYADLEEDYTLSSAPSLEVSFLFLNAQGVFSDPSLRAAVWYALSEDFPAQLDIAYLSPTSQVGATGIFGYFSDFLERRQDLEKAREYREASQSSSGLLSLTLDLPVGLQNLGRLIQKDLALIDLQIELNILEEEEFEAKVLSGLSEFYFFGWKYDLADSADFFESVVHSPTGQYGAFNGFAYSKPNLDVSIETLSTVLDVSERQESLRELTDAFLADHVAIPLFESRTLYALAPGYYFEPRLDGLILASEIFEIVVE